MGEWCHNSECPPTLLVGRQVFPSFNNYWRHVEVVWLVWLRIEALYRGQQM